MAIISLSEQQATTIPANGMLHVEAHTRGNAVGTVHLDVEGQGTVNRVSDAAVKLVSGTGNMRIRLSPVAGTEFGAGTSVQVAISRGRPGTPAATGAELPRMTLDGRPSTTVGVLNYAGDKLEIRAEGIQAERAMSGVSATVRAGIRPLIERRGQQQQSDSGIPVEVAVDASASMVALSTEEDLRLAVDILVGIVGALQPGASFRLHSGKGSRWIDVDDGLASEVLRDVAAGAGSIGAGVQRPLGRVGAPTFAISDEVMGDNSGPGLRILVGSGAETRVVDNRVLRLTPELRAALENNDTAGLRPVFAGIIDACTSNTEKDEW